MTQHARGSRATVVIPCYNEAGRLDDQGIRTLTTRPGIFVLLVDDGSTDATPSRLERLRESSDAIGVFTLPSNMGKAEAVRQGMLFALRNGPPVVAYLDADFATPPEELLGLVDAVTDDPRVSVVMAARVGLLGRQISRSRSRHYLGRVFASLAALVLRVPVYDTQCGAKAFRAGPELHAALRDPFASRWIFDVELLGRLVTGAPGVAPIPVSEMLEVPLFRWTDMHGSKLSVRARFLALFELVGLWRRLSRERRALAGRRADDESLSAVDNRAGTRPATDDDSRQREIGSLVEEHVERVGAPPTARALIPVGGEQPNQHVAEDPIVVSTSEGGQPLNELVLPVDGDSPVVQRTGKCLQVSDEVEVPASGEDAAGVLEPAAALED